MLKTFIIVGMATFTMLESRIDMNAPMSATRTGAIQWDMGRSSGSASCATTAPRSPSRGPV